MAKLKKPQYRTKGIGGRNRPKGDKPLPASLMRKEK